MSRGGIRPNAGRKSKAEKFLGPIAEAEQRIADHLPELIDKAFALAMGVTVQEPDKEGGLDVYTKPPCVKSLVYLMDRIMGKPTERVEVSGEDGEPIRHTVNLAMLPKTDLDALDRIVSQLDLDGPASGPNGDQGGEVPPVAG